MTDFNRSALDRILPASAGSADWDDVLGRSCKHERRRRLITLAAAALVAVVVTASAFAVRAFVLDKGFSGLPPVGATPSTPERGVLEMYYWVHDVRGRTRSWVYADGRLIRLGVTRDNGTPLPGLREQRLTREGVRLLRSEIISAGDSDTPSRLPAAIPSTTPTRRRSRYARVTGSSPSRGRAI